MRIPANKRKVATLALIAAALVAGTAYATIPDAGGVIHGCADRDGALRVIDPSAGGACARKDTVVDWNQRGVKGDPGPPGPPGPAGTISKLDDLEGIPCRGVNAKPASVHLSYGTGIEAPVTLICITHLVANPGPFTVHFTGGTFAIPRHEFALPSGSQFSGVIDLGGKVTVPGTGVQLADIPFESQESSNGFLDLHVVGKASFTSTGVTGFLDPAAGTANLTVGAYASVRLTATATLAGAPITLYDGTCNFGSVGSPLSLTLTTDPPGVLYSQATGAVTLSAAFTAPSLDGCNPAMGDAYVFLLNFLAGNDRLTLTGTTDPIIRAP
jgi:hypothetical protein